MSIPPFKQTVAQLLEEASDVKLFDELGSRIQDRILGEERLPLCDLSIPQRTILLVWVACIIDNGGFELLLESDSPGDPGFVYMAAAFKTIGCELAVKAFREVLSLFPGNVPPKDLRKREQIYLAVPEDRRREINCMFFNAGKSIQSLAAQYIRAHNAEFLGLPPIQSA